nr:hypothetical protein [Tanacetum cinerariifolium]
MDLKSFREMLYICPRIPGQAFAELPFEEEILEFIRFLGHGATIKTLTDVNINKLYQPWRSFAAIINKCLTRKSSGYGSFWLSQAQILVVSRHQNTQLYGAMLPIELTNDEIRNTKGYKEYYAFATGEAAPKPKASAKRKRSGSDTSITPLTATTTPTTTVFVTPQLTAMAKGKQPAKARSLSDPSEMKELVLNPGKLDVPTDESEEELSWNFFDDKGADDQEKVGDDDDDQDQEVAKHYDKDDTKEIRDVDEEGKSDEEGDNEDTRDEESFDPIPQTFESSEDEGDDVKDSHVTLTPVHPDGQQESSSVSSHFVTSMLNPPSDVGIESIFTTASSSVAPLQTSTPIMTPSTIATITTISHAPIPPTTIPIEVLPNLPTFDSMTEAVRAAVQIQTNWLRDSYQRENDEFLRTIDENMKRIIKERVKDKQRNLYKALIDAYEVDKTILDSYGETVILKRRRDDDDDQDEGPSVGSDRGYKRRREGKEPESASAPLETVTRSAGRSTTGSKSRHVSASESAFAEEPVQTTSQMEEPSYLPKKSPTPDHDWNKTLLAVQGSTQTWISKLAKQADSRSSFNELLDTPLDFSNLIMNQLRVDTMTPELLAGPTFELMKGSCTSLIELEYHLEEVYKATMDQLDWVNPEVMKTKAADYRQIKWIEDLAPRTMWIQEPIDYDKHALWGVSHWGWKRQQFYGFTVNRESALDEYSKRRIIAITNLKIVEWHSYKHLDCIMVGRDDDKLYKFKEGDFKRLRLQDIEDMLLLLVQGKLSNLTIEERFAFNVSFRMFTRRIVIQRRVEDLQLGIERYQKRLNLNKPDTYRFDLKRREAYTAYSNPRGFIYQNKDKKNRLIRIDELHKFSDETLNDVRNALDDCRKGIRMQYLPQIIWREGDKDRTAAMIQAVDKMLKTRRIMRSLEKFVG